jgi:hypothetical protein
VAVSGTRARFLLGGFVLLLGATFLGLLVFVEVPAGNERLMDFAAGIILGWGGAVIGFYFGTSEGSAAKNDAISDLAHIGERLSK